MLICEMLRRCEGLVWPLERRVVDTDNGDLPGSRFEEVPGKNPDRP